MLIQSILGGRPDPAALARSESSDAANVQRHAVSTIEQSVSAPRQDALRAIAAEYDVTDISPRTFSEMIGRLRQAGALSDKDYQELAAIRVDLEQAGIGPDDEIDLVRFYRQRLQEAAQAEKSRETPRPDLERLRARLEWLQKFAALRSPEASPIDTAA
ncbi:MAG: hypothetical protein NUV77_09790 [Thermoguttaceae bacterium]|nr:hypothetical protein [Thermoguttaceae bacterium]